MKPADEDRIVSMTVFVDDRPLEEDTPRSRVEPVGRPRDRSAGGPRRDLRLSVRTQQVDAPDFGDLRLREPGCCKDSHQEIGLAGDVVVHLEDPTRSSQLQAGIRESQRLIGRESIRTARWFRSASDPATVT